MAKRRNWLKATLTVANGKVKLEYQLDGVEVCTIQFENGVVEAVAFRELVNNLPTVVDKVKVLQDDPKEWFQQTIAGISRRAQGISRSTTDKRSGRVSESEIEALKASLRKEKSNEEKSMGRRQ